MRTAGAAGPAPLTGRTGSGIVVGEATAATEKGGFHGQRRCHHRRRARRHLHSPGDAEKGQQTEDSHCGEGPGGGGPPLSQEQGGPVRELQALLPHHHRLLRGRGLLRRQAVPQLRGGGRSAQPHRSGQGPGDHRLHRRHLPGVRRGQPRGGPGQHGGGQGHPQAGHPGGSLAASVPISFWRGTCAGGCRCAKTAGRRRFWPAIR